MKKILTFICAITIAISCGSVAFATNIFPDVANPETARDTATLYMLGVISGDSNGKFNPNSNLTRAQFCKMAVIMMGNGEDEPMYRNRTIFPDVTSTHWARGYINIAVTGETKIIQGNGDGTFKPDSTITYAQAITILARILKYSDSDAGYMWPAGYLSLANDIGLSDGINLSANNVITRTQAVRLFCNLLRTEQKAGGKYINSLGTAAQDNIILNINAKSADGMGNAVYTSNGTYKVKTGTMPSEFLGVRGTLLTDTDGKIKTFLPDTDKIQKNIIVAEIQSAWIKDNNGNKFTVASGKTAYTADKISTYDAMWTSVKVGQSMTLYFDSSEEVEAVFINSEETDTATVAKNKVTGNPFLNMLDGDTDYLIYKNGEQITLADICRYDVAIYDKSAKILHLSDFRITACYENAYPNTNSPKKITIMGHEFDVLESAYADLNGFKIGDKATFLFTYDDKIAGALSSTTVSSTAVGVVQSASPSNVSVKLVNGISVSGKCNISSDALSSLVGELVTVSSNAKGQISVTKISNATEKYGNLNIEKLMVGNVQISKDVKIYECVGQSTVSQIFIDDIYQNIIDGDKIIYAGRNTNQRINLLILDDVTGDAYTYGFFKFVSNVQDSDNVTEDNSTVTIRNSGNNKTIGSLSTKSRFPNDVAGGLVSTTDGKVAGSIQLKSTKNIKRSAFKFDNDQTKILLSGVEMLVSEQVECYNDTTDSWFSSIDDMLKFSDTFTIYYDKEPDNGGKVRLIVAE